jgi:4-hydroxy-tetrahydrodipicolinate reductase
MGKLIVKMLSSAGHKVVSVVDAPGTVDLSKDAGLLAGISELGVKVSSSDKLSETLDETKPDVVVDFTTASACVGNAKTVSGKKINLVIGTTGFTEAQKKEIEDTVKKNKVGAVLSPNMSVGVNAYWKLVAEAAKTLKGYDVEVIEAHHRFKKDAPSGTALKTAEVICEAQGRSLKDVGVYGRKGDAPRKEGEIGIHAIRAGDIVGEHTVLFSTLGERLEVTHRAHSREAFVSGVMKAVDFIAGKKGFYDMKDVLGL